MPCLQLGVTRGKSRKSGADSQPVGGAGKRDGGGDAGDDGDDPLVEARRIMDKYK